MFIPGQISLLQDATSSASPSQSASPLPGAGLLQVLDQVWSNCSECSEWPLISTGSKDERRRCVRQNPNAISDDSQQTHENGRPYIARHIDLLANELLIFLDPQHGQRGPGRPHLTYIDMLKKDSGHQPLQASVNEIQTVMLDHEVWRGVVAARTKKPTLVIQ